MEANSLSNIRQLSQRPSVTGCRLIETLDVLSEQARVALAGE